MKIIKHLLLLWPVISALLVNPADATEQTVKLPETVTIQQLFDITRDISPRFETVRQRLELANAEIVAAKVLPNPRISYGRYDLLTSKNTMFDGHVQEQVMLEVPILISGQRGARVNDAEKRVAATEADIETEFIDIFHQVWLLYLQQLTDKERIAVLEDTVDYMSHLSEIVVGRYHAGTASRYDLVRIEIEARTLQTRLETVRNDLAAKAGDLGVLLGLSGWKPQAEGDLALLGVETDANKLWQQAIENNPEIESARRNQAAALAGVERAERERWPVPSLQLGSVFTDKPYGNTSFAGVAVDIPIFDRGQGAIARAEGEKRSAKLKLELTTESTRSALQKTVDLLLRKRETRATFEKEVLDKLIDLKAMGEASYRLGKGSLLELLDASRSRTETQLTYLDLMQSEIQAELDVLKSAGLLVNIVQK